MNNDWIKEIDWSEHLSELETGIAEKIGIENLLTLIDNYSGVPIYFSNKSILSMKKAYIRKQHPNDDAISLALFLDVSAQFVYNTRKESNKDNDIKRLNYELPFGNKEDN